VASTMVDGGCANVQMSMLDNDTVAIMKRRVFDIAGSTDKSVKVYLNGEKLKVKNFKEYVGMFVNSQENPVIHQVVSDRWEIAVTLSEGSFQQVSFVNSIATYKGGKHVDHVVDQITEKLIAHIKKKHKSLNVRPSLAKNQLSIFINCLIENPAFNSQTKECMNSQVKKFGSTCAPNDKFFKDVMNSGVVDNILNSTKMKNSAELKKNDGKKKSRIGGIGKLDDANDAGGKNAQQCALILTEGDSAKALAVSGLGVVGRDHYGVFPLKGKLLNVRDASHDQIMKNAEITNIKQIMGLQHGKVYTDTKSLRYGHLMIMADQDHDGSHIKGLVINFIHTFWPSLLQIPGFIQEFVTPIVKVTKGKVSKSFFTLMEYEAWKGAHNDGKGWKIKYYKGLGTSTSAEAKEYFSDLGQHQLDFSYGGEHNDQDLKMAFAKDKVNERKDWLNNYDSEVFVDHSLETLDYSDFVHKELIQFSMADNERSIPSVMDGLKPGQRKILFACFKRKLKQEIKVAQLAGYVSEHAAYHHGEASLCGTIQNMAQNFIGSNNINVLVPAGQFGTRLQGGKDAASPRYIFTCLTRMARALYREEDDYVLDFKVDDGLSVEPHYYCPVIPMVLVNGADGIGTGWSTQVPNFNPQEIIANLRRLINGEAMESMLPWYRSFTGSITRKQEKKGQESKAFETAGIITRTGDTTVEITELPIKKWTQDYKEFLEESVLDNGKAGAFIKDYKEHHTDTKVKFIVTMPSMEALDAAEANDYKQFKLTSSVTMSNMTLFHEGHLRSFESPEAVLETFFAERMKIYGKRKTFMINKLGAEFRKLDNRVRFILMVIARELVISNRKKGDLLVELKEKGFEQFAKEKKESQENEQEEEEEDDEDSAIKPGAYDYLLGMPMWSLTYERVEALKKEAEEKKVELDRLEGMSLEDIYIEDLDELEEVYEEWQDAVAKGENQKVKVKPGGKSKGGKKAAKTKAAHIMDMSDEDDIVSSEDSDFDEGPKKSKKKPAAKAAPKPKAAPARAAPAPAAKPAPKPVPPPKPEAEMSLMERIARRQSSDGTSGLPIPIASDDDDVAPVKAAPKRAPAKKPVAVDLDSDDSEDDKPAIVKKAAPKKAAPKKPAAAKKPAVKAKATVIEDSDDDDDDFNEQVSAPAARPRAGRAAAQKASSKMKFDSDGDESDDESGEGFGDNSESDSECDEVVKEPAKAVAKKPAAKKPAAKVAPKPDFEISDDEEEDAPKAVKPAPKKRALAPKQTKNPPKAAEKKRAAPTKSKQTILESPSPNASDDEIEEVPTPSRASPAKKKSKGAKGATAKPKVDAQEAPAARRPGRAAAAAATSKLAAKEEEKEVEESEPEDAGNESEPQFSHSEEEDDDGSVSEFDDDSDF